MGGEQIAAIQKVTKAKLAIRERQRTALELRLAGRTFREIAAELGYKSPHGAFDAVETALAEITRQPAESVRTMELERLDAMHAGFWEKAQRGDPVAVAACLRIAERRAKLLGLDKPEPIADPRPLKLYAIVSPDDL